MFQKYPKMTPDTYPRWTRRKPQREWEAEVQRLGAGIDAMAVHAYDRYAALSSELANAYLRGDPNG